MTANDADPALTAAAMRDHFGFDLELAPSVVLIFDTSLMPARATTRAQRKATHPFRQVGTLGDGVDMVVAAGPGAPVAAITVEFFAAFGVHQLISVGTAGYLSAGDGPLPRHSVIGQAASDEGTSAYYGTDLTANTELTNALVDLAGGPSRTALTTDVPFRHTPDRLAVHRQRADLVEMECAALFASARYFGLGAGSLLVTSDVFDHREWRPLPRRDVTTALHDGVRIASQVLAPS